MYDCDGLERASFSGGRQGLLVESLRNRHAPLAVATNRAKLLQRSVTLD
jgi:hypothetical protein